MNKNKVSDMAKDFGLTSKDILSVLSTYEDGSKKPSQVLSADEVNLIFEHLTQKQQEKFLHMYEVLKTEFSNRSRSYKAMIEMEIIHYFIDFIRDNPELTPIKDETAIHKSSKYQTIYNIADYISDHYAESISLDGLAGIFYLSKFYLSRSFKEVTGYGVNEYVNILRTKRAKQLLEETTLSVSEIAGTVGYESITYFEKVFKTYMSISPLKYRKTLNGITYKNTITPEAPKQ